MAYHVLSTTQAEIAAQLQTHSKVFPQSDRLNLAQLTNLSHASRLYTMLPYAGNDNMILCLESAAQLIFLAARQAGVSWYLDLVLPMYHP